MVQTTVPPDNANYALEKLRELLRSGGVAPDGKLPTERSLSEQLGIGRRAIRRALEVLEAEGEIWRRQGAGTFIGSRPGEWSGSVDAIVAGTDFMEIMEVRLRIEPQLAQLAALRAKPAELARMRDLARKIMESDDADARELWDGALHRQIAQSARNQLFLAIFDMINHVRQDEAWQNIRERARSSGSVGITYAQHEGIIEAIAARDPAKAGEAMRQHLLMLQERLVRATSMDQDAIGLEALPEVG
ncbi:FadR/GntR family transcriptional regulator [Rhizobium oryziradicis]|uniref:GntR family transcriptional regulator n=1 Tax=Rhizobium oryziradicis TaxID=1867956 RepID=A0A1Q8ZSK5_9HYPH|nr:FadR/GntR family transcriptional regulator [Rhizobium oryziradicis]OLP44972.1 GntR family transcriptional regulator [Rhizobium oryziradicis]